MRKQYLKGRVIARIICLFNFFGWTNTKLLGETNIQPQKFPPSGSKAKDGEKERQTESGARKATLDKKNNKNNSTYPETCKIQIS